MRAALGIATTVQHNRAHWLRLLLAIVIAQSVFWLLIRPAERPAFSDMTRLEQYQVAVLEEGHLATVQQLPESAWQTREGFWFDCCEIEHFAVRWHFDLEHVPADDLGVAVGVSADNYFVWVNGFALVDAGRLEPTSTYHGRWTRGVQRVSRAMLREGRNEILAISARNGGGYTDLWVTVLGGFEEMSNRAARRTFMVNDLRLINMILIGATAMFAAVLIPVTYNRAFAIWLTVLAATYALRIAYHRWWEPPMDPEWFTIYNFALSALLPVAWFNFLDAWSGIGWPRVRRWLLGLYVAVMITLAVMIVRDKAWGYEIASDTVHWLYLGLGLAAALVFVWRTLRASGGRYVEVAAFVLGITAMMVDAVYELLFDRAQGNLQTVLPIVLMGLVAAILARNVRVYESTAAFNAQLTNTLALREQEISERYAELREAQRERDLAQERQRLLQDMHDGIGGKLNGLLLQARAGDVNREEMQLGIEDSLSDLRLVIESLHAQEASFAEVMESMQERLARQLASAGIELVWDVALDVDQSLDPTASLQVLRVLQEAVTNAVRHAQAQRIEVVLQHLAEKGVYQLHIADDGTGMPESRVRSERPGFGLASMQRRAAMLNGTLQYLSLAPGTCVVLEFPA